MTSWPARTARSARESLGGRPKRVVFLADESIGILRDSDQPKVPGLLGFDPDPRQVALWEALDARDVTIELLLPEGTDDASLAAVSAEIPERIRVRARSDGENPYGSTAATRARTIVVSADRWQRSTALAAGASAVPHGLIAMQLVDGEEPVFAAIRGDALLPGASGPILPYHLERLEDGSWLSFAVLSERQVAGAAASGVDIARIGIDLQREDPVLLRLDQPVSPETREELERHQILFSHAGRLLIGLSDAHRIGRLRIDGAHGCVKLLRPSPGLSGPTPAARVVALQEMERAAAWPEKAVTMLQATVLENLLELLERTCLPSAEDFANDVARYSGQADLDDSGSIASRHVDHPDNARIVSALLRELRALGYCAYTHDFAFEGRTVSSVIADLPGTGFLRIKPEILEELRVLLARRDLPTDQLLHSVGGALERRDAFAKAATPHLRADLRAAALLHPWWPWWRLNCLHRLPGPGAEIVIVGCHLDSTAASSYPFDPASDPAPGADDDASGIAATLAAARYMKRFAGKLRHTVRFCFFNAEEVGIVGSQAYAAAMQACGAPIRGVVCTDMVGWDSDAHALFEIHAGHGTTAMRDASVLLANRIRDWGNATAGLHGAQVYSGLIGIEAADRTIYDPAIGRSDHASFQDQGFPAVVVSEDFFMNTASEAARDRNPHYHRITDTTVNGAYGARVACAVARAVREMAAGH